MATEPLHFARAPIIEAIIGIQVAALPETSLADFRAIGEQVRTDYPNQTEISFTQFTGQVLPQPSASATQTLIGLQFQSADQRQLFQARLNGFSFHRLAPYGNWDSFRGEAFRKWQLYRNAAGPMQMEVFSVRYINRLVVPAPGQLEHYIKVYPEIPPELPQMLRNYLLRLELPLEEGGGVLTMHETMLPSEPGTASILLDNDFRYPAMGITEDQLWDRIDLARHQKNNVFLACITEEMRRRIS